MSELAITPHAESRLVPTAAVAALLAPAAAAWILLAGRMAGMDTGPGGDPGSPVLIVIGLAVAAAPTAVPGLTI